MSLRIITGRTSKSITSLKPGDYVLFNGSLREIDDIWGVSAKGRLAKPSEGGFWVVTTGGQKIDMWMAQAYYKKEDVCDSEIIST